MPTNVLSLFVDAISIVFLHFELILHCLVILILSFYWTTNKSESSAHCKCTGGHVQIYLIHAQSIPKWLHHIFDFNVQSYRFPYWTCSVCICVARPFQNDRCIAFGTRTYNGNRAGTMYYVSLFVRACGWTYSLFFVRVINFGRLRVQTLLMFYIICFFACIRLFCWYGKWKKWRKNTVSELMNLLCFEIEHIFPWFRSGYQIH